MNSRINRMVTINGGYIEQDNIWIVPVEYLCYSVYWNCQIKMNTYLY